MRFEKNGGITWRVRYKNLYVENGFSQLEGQILEALILFVWYCMAGKDKSEREFIRRGALAAFVFVSYDAGGMFYRDMS